MEGRGVVDAGIAIEDLESDGGADGFSVADAGEDIDGIGLDFLSCATAIAALSSAEFVVDDVLVDGDTGGHSLDEGDEGFAV